ncbi:precorrin-2 dehydrogenase/sirohydrochlorin ferrochelatase family protein [Paenibacillus sp. SAF-054]|uniref:precorrin-2 dehydrogenase/sirohydrochlorin ferrochelatase family protein n=1 Tax=unclassified Paenibacillus TaxID=185978 RepID=UPI003F7F30A1
MAVYMPIMLDCEGKVCVVIGGGRVAERKIKELLAASARITVISPTVTTPIQQYHEEGKLEWLPRRYAEGDLNGAFMLYAAADDSEANRLAAAEAKAKGILANVADQPEMGSFIHPSVLRRGRLVIAVSTSGAGPLAARAIRRKLEDDYGNEFEVYLDHLYAMRRMIQQQVSDPAMRQALLRKASGPEVLDSVRQGGFKPGDAEEIRKWINDNQEEWECGQS